MKKYLFAALMCMISAVANAQWKVTSIDESEMVGNQFLQVLQTDESTLIYGTLTKDDGKVYKICVDPETTVVVKGMRYKLQNSVNVPVSDDAEHRTVKLDKQLNTVNYVMQFEKFNPENGFDLIESSSKHGDSMFNFKGIHVTKIDESEALDTKRFLDCPHVIRGYYYKNGSTYSYYIKDDLMVRQQTTKSGAVIFYTKIVNNSGRGISFDLSKVTVMGKKKGKETPVKLYTPDKYEHKLAVERYYEAKSATGGYLSDDLNFKLGRERNRTNNGWAQLGIAALEGLNTQAQQNRIAKYLDEHPDNGPRALRSTTVANNEEVYGYVAAKNKSFESMTMTIPINGYNYIFTWTLK